jgi:phosphorylcholine metabolism protein LicD
MYVKIFVGLILAYFVLVIIVTAFLLCRREVIRKLFVDTINVLNKNNINYWVDFGTLLGICRNKDIIFGDDDADICIPESQEDKVEKALTNSELVWKKFEWGAFRTYTRLFGKEYFTDIFIAKPKGENYQIPSAGDTPIELLSDINMESVMVGDYSIKIMKPKRSNELLEFRYGKKWKIPLKKWYLFYNSFLDVKIPQN